MRFPSLLRRGSRSARVVLAGLVGLGCQGVLPSVVWAQAAAPAAQTQVPQVLAEVSGEVITLEAFSQAFSTAARNKFYHGRPNEADVAQFQREVLEGAIDKILMVKEAERRKIKPDAAAIQKAIDGYDRQYAQSEHWKANRARLLPGLVSRLESDDVLAQMEAIARRVSPPTPAQLQAYWAKHQDKFTEPEQIRAAMILLKVDPASPQTKWDAALKEAQSLHQKLKAGADFAELAKLHSGDGSAAEGGDLGYLHQGMLPPPAEDALKKMAVGDLSEPVQLLEGMAILKLSARRPAKLNPLDAVRERAKELYERDQAEVALAGFKAKLRQGAKVTVNQGLLMPLPAPTGK